MLAVEVELLTGRYVATAYNTRGEGEWPPHPARLFSALVATHFASERPSPDEKAALEWLAAQEPPSIVASDATHREVVTVFVPVNDAGMTDVDEEAAAVQAARVSLDDARRSGMDKAVKQAERALQSAEKRLSAAIAQQTKVPKSTLNPAIGRRVLPEHRVRQPRTFPSVTPESPYVTFVWPSAEPSDAQRSAIDGLLSRLVRLGHSSTLVAARLVEGPHPIDWRPTLDGETTLRTVRPGQLSALERAYSLHRETEPRLMPATFQPYTRRAPDRQDVVVGSLFSDDWLVLRRVGGPALPMTATVAVARTLRKALMVHAPNVTGTLCGHTADGRPLQTDHLAIVPLPFVGHHQASGTILGVALVLPRNTPMEEKQSVFAALAAWERAERIEGEDTPRLRLMLGPAGVLELERVEWGARPSSLRSATWCDTARVWHSVTPVALDRNPGDLRSREPLRIAAAVTEAAATMRRACARIGLPEPEEVAILPAPSVAGAAKARHYPAFPETSGRTRRVLTHVTLRFRDPVRGPILLGAGRYVGLGLLRPESEHG
jgi:CRISPR-associated protein Csb2